MMLEAGDPSTAIPFVSAEEANGVLM